MKKIYFLFIAFVLCSKTIFAVGHIVTPFVINNVSCFWGNDAKAYVTVIGGVGPFTYSWSLNSTPIQVNDSLLNVTAGTYICTVTDQNDMSTATASVTITQPLSLVISNILVTDVTCFGLTDGQLSTSVSGGTTPYTYYWTSSSGNIGQNSPLITNLSAGSYTLSVVDANNCTGNQTATIIEPSPLLLDSVVNTAHCGLANGSATIIVNGGTPFSGNTYFCQWNTTPVQQITATATNLTANTYHVIVTDAQGCIASSDVIVPDAPGPTVSNMSSYPAICYGSLTGTLDVDATGGTPPLIYMWTNASGQPLFSGPAPNDSIVGIPAGTYSLLILDANGCSFSTVATVAQPFPVILVASPDVSFCFGSSAQISASVGGGTPPYSWTWTLEGTTVHQTTNSPNLFDGPYNESPVYSATNPNSNYIVTVVDANGCASNTSGDTIIVTTLPPITANIVSSNACSGETTTFTANASGGNGNSYTYAWSSTSMPAQTGSSINVVASGTTISYTVEVNDGCSTPATASVTSTVYPKPIASILSPPTSGCENLNVLFQADTSLNASGTIYSWNFGDNSAPALSSSVTHLYSISSTVLDTFSVVLYAQSPHGCIDTTFRNNHVVVYPFPDSTVSINGSTLTANESGASYQWVDCDNGFSPIAGETNQTFIANTNGNYAVQIISNYGCTTMSSCIIVDDEEMVVFPSPANEYININNLSVGSETNIFIKNTLGQPVYEAKTTHSTNKIDITSLTSGVYFVFISTDTANKMFKIFKH